MPAGTDEHDDAYRRWEAHSGRLFEQVSRNFLARRLSWENEHGEVDDETAAFLFERPTVCVEHLRFVPCRRCLYVEPATVAYSDAVEDIQRVREYHEAATPPAST